MLSSPLRYPGGKAKLFPFFASLISENKLFGMSYCEPYAGGAGLGLRLLSAGFVDDLQLNDIDRSIYAFWKSILEEPDDFCAKVDSTECSIDEWHHQRFVRDHPKRHSRLELGFATFFLNRTNRSGIIEGGGPIGGYHQAGTWQLGVRFNRPALIAQIQQIKRFSKQIRFTNLDAARFLEKRLPAERCLVYLDPPYFIKGFRLYKNFYEHDDHKLIAALLWKHRRSNWVLTYDDVPQIRKMYSRFAPVSYRLAYSAGEKGSGKEVIYFSQSLSVPPLKPLRSLAA